MTHTLYNRPSHTLTLFAGLTLFALLGACSDEPTAAPSTPAQAADQANPDATAANSWPELAMGDMILGDATAPITVIEYASMTCSHCAGFHKGTFPRLKENFIDTGKIQFVFREFPLDVYALEASIMARCAGADRYFEVVHEIFARQEEWILSRSPRTIRRNLQNIGEDMGVTEEMNATCQENEALQKRIAAKAAEGRTRYEVAGTPAVVINGKLFVGAPNYNNLARHIEDILAGDQ
jgi:protein-disulfide isomerase